MSIATNEFQHNIDSAFKMLKTISKSNIGIESNFDTCPDVTQMELNLTQIHNHRIEDLCSHWFDSASYVSNNLLTGKWSYEMSTQNVCNASNMSTSHLSRATGFGSHPWSFIDSSSQALNITPHDYMTAHLGNIGRKIPNSFVQFDSLSNLSNIQNNVSISNSVTPFTSSSNLCLPVSAHGKFNHQDMSSSHLEYGVNGVGLSWSTAHGNGFLASRCYDTGLYMTSYGKPKRVRTAFSPAQLLKLEHVFEKNHYVVGRERQDLSALLNLSETQVSVKVWFQNRRTKHKKLQADDDITDVLTPRRMPPGSSAEPRRMPPGSPVEPRRMPPGSPVEHRKLYV